MEGFFNATYAGLEGRGTRCRRQWRREPEPRKARKKMASLTFFFAKFYTALREPLGPDLGANQDAPC